jgi:hypothetical protein
VSRWFHLELVCDIQTFYRSATDLGVYTAYANRFHEKEVISTTQLASAVAIVPVVLNTLLDTTLWIVHSFDRVRASIY